ncbi:pyridoxamine 5'-phosphate oxidase family protein [Saccharopolyspora gloriosae]|uniref:pyridoxamine 5'-phosphate oxidase family protein n=1 Tax=Saccharopolyspora gloriosae TaxID=455344 RepID=UPI001FB81218|nr:pyridoxamine 5'-phosphate oxidase family protein [Saccharopolyspora gloriosae]
MRIDDELSAVLAEVRVLELSTIARDGGLNVRPMAGAWVPETQQIIITTPLSYPQKAFNIRRDGRVALLFSDPTGSGLSGKPNVLVQGTASAPNVIAPPQDIKDYWAELLRKSPTLADEVAEAEAQGTMDWYYLRLPFFVTPERVHALEAPEAGGTFEPYPPEEEPLAVQVKDALSRYPTAVFAARDTTGHPYAVRARVSESDVDGELVVRTSEDFAGKVGPANLLWHRHDGRSGEMLSLHVAGTAYGSGREWRFTPERIPGALASGHGAGSFEEWIDDGRARTEQYLQRRGLAAPRIDWSALTALAPS